jgi:hypothetical protein
VQPPPVPAVVARPSEIEPDVGSESGDREGEEKAGADDDNDDAAASADDDDDDDGFGEFEDAVAGGAPHARKGEAASDGAPAAVDGGDDRNDGTAFGVALPDLTFMLPRSGTDGGNASSRGAVDLDGGGV